MKRIMLAVFLAALSCARAQDRDTVYQVSTLGALMAGEYEGRISSSNVLGRGDFGIGTIHGLDGEVVVLDGAMFQIPEDRTPREVGGDALMPYAIVTFFEADVTGDVRADGPIPLSTLKALLDSRRPSGDVPYAVRVAGLFDRLKIRTVPRQVIPYPPLVKALEGQIVSELENVRGTLVGFWFPKYMDGATAGEYHLHFLADDRSAGGHLLDGSIEEGTFALDACEEFVVDWER